MLINHYNICAALVYTLALAAILMRARHKGFGISVFLALTVSSLAATLMDISAVQIFNRPPIYGSVRTWAELATYAYFLLRNVGGLLYLIFILSWTRLWGSMPLWMKRVLWIPYGVCLLMLASNPWTKLLFVITEYGYARGNGILWLHLLTILYSLISLSVLLRSRNMVRVDKWLPLISIYVFNFSAVVIQYFFPMYLVEMFATSISILLITLVAIRPEETMDLEVGMPNYQGYKEELRKLLIISRSCKILMIQLRNAEKVKAFFGEERYNQSLRRICHDLELLFQKAQVGHELFFERPSMLYVVITEFSNEDVRMESHFYPAIRGILRKVEDMGVKFQPKLCLLDVPGDLSEYQEILNFSHIFPRIMDPKQAYTDAKHLVLRQNFQIENHIEEILQRAIKGNNFEMYYQPIYGTKEKRFVSAEALIRLKDERFGFVPPGVFIPAAEQRGLMNIIGDFVLESVYRFVSEQDFAALGLKYVELNLSVEQCLSKSLPLKLERLRKKYNIDISKINFEITETTYDNVAEAMESNLRELSQMGYCFSMDDYGTGYSNIQRIFKLPLKIVKIDKSLVDSMDSPGGVTVMKSTIGMMKELNLDLVVEGVETAEVMRQLEQKGCDFIQGYYFSKPLPEKEFIEFLQNNLKKSQAEA